MADPGRPPATPYFPDVHNRVYPPDIEAKNKKAFGLEFQGKHIEADQAHKELQDAIAERAKKGIADSGLNKRTAKLPLVRKHMGGRTRRGKKGAGWKDVAMGFAQDEMDEMDSKQGAEWTQKQLDKTKGQLGNLMTQLGPIAQLAAQSKGGRTTRRAATSGGDIVCHLLTIRNQVKLYHWQTGSFARHKATDDLTASLDLNIDAFVESYMGRYGRPKVSGGIKLHNFSESAARSFVAKETAYLQKELPRKIGKDDTDLLNLRDTILGDLTKVLYLFTLT